MHTCHSLLHCLLYMECHIINSSIGLLHRNIVGIHSTHVLHRSLRNLMPVLIVLHRFVQGPQAICVWKACSSIWVLYTVKISRYYLPLEAMMVQVHQWAKHVSHSVCVWCAVVFPCRWPHISHDTPVIEPYLVLCTVSLISVMYWTHDHMIHQPLCFFLSTAVSLMCRLPPLNYRL